MDTNDSQDMKIVESIYKKYRLLTIENKEEIDLYSVHELQANFKSGNADGIEHWAIDLSNVFHIDSSGLGCLANQGLLLAKKSNKLFVINPQSGVKHLFAVSGFDKIFTVISDKQDLPE